jgi:hypothetical protein
MKCAGGKTLIFARQRQSLKDWSDFSELFAVQDETLIDFQGIMSRLCGIERPDSVCRRML